LGSRDLPPLPTSTASQLGSQQSLASKEIQLIGSASANEIQACTSVMLGNDGMRQSPYHSREGSLDNEMFLYHRFTQGSSIGDPYRKQQSSDEFSSSDTTTTNYEQEYRKYHLENIQEVSNTLEHPDVHNTSVISQDLNISYNSVYDSRLLQSKVYRIEDHPALKKRKSLDEHQESSSTILNLSAGQNLSQRSTQQENALASPRSKVPYYVSDIFEGVDIGACTDGSNQNLDKNLASLPAAGTMVDVITKSMNALDMESNSYFETRNELENERIRKLRRSYTPDPYNSTKPKGGPSSVLPQNDSHPLSPETSSVYHQHYSEGNATVSRSKSLEGLLGDSPGTPKDNLGYNATSSGQQVSRMYSPHNFNDIPVQPKPARGHQPPPPPDGVPPLDIRPLTSSAVQRGQILYDISAGRGAVNDYYAAEDEKMWADTLRKTSLRQQSVRSPELLKTSSIENYHGRHSVVPDERGMGHTSWKASQAKDGRQSVPPAVTDQQQLRSSEGRPGIPPPTAPKPKTPVPTAGADTSGSMTYMNCGPIQRNASAANVLEQQQQQQLQNQPQKHHHQLMPNYTATGTTTDQYGHPHSYDRNSEPLPSRKSSSGQGNFLEYGLPPPISKEAMAVEGRLPDARSMTLPTRGNRDYIRSSSTTGAAAQLNQAHSYVVQTSTASTQLHGSRSRLPSPPKVNSKTASSQVTSMPIQSTDANTAPHMPRETPPVRQATKGTKQAKLALQTLILVT
jgi:hypothetical protein